MPDTEKLADGQQGTATVTVTTAETPKPESKKLDLTQEQLDKIIADRVARAVPSDYEELKALKEEKNAATEKEKTELQKAQESEAKAKRERDEARAETLKAKRETAIQLEAVSQGGDPELIALALAGDATIKVEDGQVVGVKEAVEALLVRKPNLKLGGVRQSGGEFGGTDGKTISEKIAELEKKGDRDSLREARTLKLTQTLARG